MENKRFFTATDYDEYKKREEEFEDLMAGEEVSCGKIIKQIF